MRGTSRTGRGAFTFQPAPPLHIPLTLARHGRWGEDPASVYRDGSLLRVLRVGERLVPFRLSGAGPVEGPTVRVTFGGPDDPAVRDALRRTAGQLLGETHDLAGFYARVTADRVLGPLVRPDGGLWGFRPPLVPDPFEMLVGAIAAQQVNLSFAFAIRARLVRRYGEAVVYDGATVYAFPSPAAVAAASPAVLRAMQFSTRKAEYIVGLAREIAAGRLDLDGCAHWSDARVIRRLTAVRGLGRWTAEWFLARGLGRPDVCPADDVGVRRAVDQLCFGGRASDSRRVRRRVRVWRPYRSLATHYLLAAADRRRPPAAALAPLRAAGA